MSTATPTPPEAGGVWDVVGVGANSVDYVHILRGRPEPRGPNAKMRIGRRDILCGGQVATAMCACARFGLRALYAGVTGSDDNGARVRRALSGRGVDLSHLIVRDAENQYAVILVDETTGSRIVLWDRDERLAMRDDEIPSRAIAAARLVHVDDVDQEAAIRAAGAARARGVPVTSDVDRLTSRTAEFVAAVSMPILAEHVPALLTGLSDLDAALRALRQPHHRLVCVTLGDKGAVALDDTGIHRSPAFAVNVVDTTGAGDVFRAGFIYAFLKGWATPDTLRFANAAAAASCTRLGALDGIPSLEEVESVIARARRA